ncbi:MAG: thioesterase domain-containing protein, partial [Phycisphaerales bacterium]
GSGVQIWLEASARSFAQSDLTEFAARFAEHLHRSTGSGELLCNPVTPPQEMTAPPSNYRPKASVHPPRTIEVLRGLWVDAVGVPPHENPNFFECGGSSLLAMRLASSIHARTGMKLHIGEFLRSATFDGLLEWVRDDPEAPYSDFRRAGGDRHGRVIAAFPGSSGRGIDLHAFWSAYRELDPSVDRMIGCDLATIAATIPSPARDQDIPGHFIDRGTQIASEQSAGHEIVVMGYSLGGLIAMGVVERLLEQGHRVSRLVLLDAYGPKYLARTPTALAAKVNARLRGRFDRNQSSEAAVARSQSSSTVDQTSREMWRFIHSEFTGWTPPRVMIPTILVRSESAARRMRPLIRASTNGLGQYLLGPLETITLPVDHLAILTSGSSEVARAVASACGSVDNASDVPTIS